MQDEWTGCSLVEYYVCAGVGARLVPLHVPHSQMQPPGPPPRAAPPGGAPARASPQRAFPDADDRFQAHVLARFPEQDRPTTPFPRECPDFCFPDGIRLVTLEEHQRDPMPVTNSFVLTTADRTRVYGVCITWMDALDAEVVRRFVGDAHGPVYAQQAVCLISRVPAFELLIGCCRQLYRLHITHATMPLARVHVQPALDARLAPAGACTRLTLGGLCLEVQTPSQLDIPRSMASASDWMLITKCLDAHNLVAVWGLLLAEQKVLFLSAHTHVLTMACETLVSVLYPFRWEHVYVPVLPSRLANFLQAPVPFLVGVTPDVIHATDEIPSDVVQVHLDNNTVILDQALYHKLRLPPRAKRKLLRKMQRVCRPPGPVHADRDSGNGGNGGGNGNGGGADGEGAAGGAAGPPASDGGAAGVGVHGRLVSAFQLPPHPEDVEGTEAGYDSDGTEVGDGAADAAVPALALRAVKAWFLRFFTSLLEKLPELYVMPPANVSARAVALDFFDEERLLSSCPEQCREWLSMLTRSQAFAEFLHERLTNDGTRHEIAFFNESVDAKRNRSRLTLSKRATPLLTTGRLPAGFASRAPPLPVRSVYERLCAAAGRDRPSASTRVAVLVIGGSAGSAARERGKHANALPAFVESVRREFARELLWTRLADSASGLVVHSVTWTSSSGAHAARFAPHALEGLALREALFDLEAMASARSAERERVRAAVASGLAQLAQLAGAGAPLCVVAIGVAGLVGCELLAEIQAASAAVAPAGARGARAGGGAVGTGAGAGGHADGGDGRGAAGGAGAADGSTVHATVDVSAGGGPLTTALQRCQTLSAIATLGVPLGLADGGKACGLRVPAAHAAARWAHLRGSWLNFHHRDDALSAPIRALCSGARVHDVECKGRPSRRRELAGQLLYLVGDAREIVQPLAKAFGEVWQDTNIVFGASVEAHAPDEPAAGS